MYLFFDTETTGLPQRWGATLDDLDNWPRMVQAAWILHDNYGREIASQSYIVKPDNFTIPADVALIHGITTQKALKEGFPLRNVLREFTKAANEARFLVAHNISFDEKIVGAEFLRSGMENILESKTKICTMKCSAEYCAIENRYGYKWPKLAELHYQLFGTVFAGAHNAAADIKITAKCFWELKRLGVL